MARHARTRIVTRGVLFDESTGSTRGTYEWQRRYQHTSISRRKKWRVLQLGGWARETDEARCILGRRGERQRLGDLQLWVRFGQLWRGYGPASVEFPQAWRKCRRWTRCFFIDLMQTRRDPGRTACELPYRYCGVCVADGVGSLTSGFRHHESEEPGFHSRGRHDQPSRPSLQGR